MGAQIGLGLQWVSKSIGQVDLGMGQVQLNGPVYRKTQLNWALTLVNGSKPISLFFFFSFPSLCFSFLSIFSVSSQHRGAGGDLRRWRRGGVAAAWIDGDERRGVWMQTAALMVAAYWCGVGDWRQQLGFKERERS